MSERGAMITLCGSQYELILTTKATKEINRRYGGLGKLGDRLSKAETFEETIDELVWLLTLLINQGILVHNAVNKLLGEKQKPLFSEDDIEVLTSPADFADYKDAIFEALQKGAMRHIKSEENPKNVTVG
ncbi:MAG: hypothetical protein II679_03310 [Ruminococcus sp.]|mgnify:FL=1|nr:hypothetical protein [Ruminococcus sp.]